MSKLTTVKGGDITTAHTVHICYTADDRTGQFIWPELTADDWGDPAVVVKVEPINAAKVLLTVAPNHSESLEQVEALITGIYTVVEEESK